MTMRASRRAIHNCALRLRPRRKAPALLGVLAAWLAVGPLTLAAAPRIAVIERLEIVDVAPGVELEIVVDRPLVWTVLRDEDGHLRIELPQARPGHRVVSRIFPGGLVAEVRIVSAGVPSRPLTQIVVSTRGTADHRLDADGTRLRLELVPTGLEFPRHRATAVAPPLPAPAVEPPRPEPLSGSDPDAELSIGDRPASTAEAPEDATADAPAPLLGLDDAPPLAPAEALSAPPSESETGAPSSAPRPVIPVAEPADEPLAPTVSSPMVDAAGDPGDATAQPDEKVAAPGDGRESSAAPLATEPLRSPEPTPPVVTEPDAPPPPAADELAPSSAPEPSTAPVQPEAESTLSAPPAGRLERSSTAIEEWELDPLPLEGAAAPPAEIDSTSPYGPGDTTAPLRSPPAEDPAPPPSFVEADPPSPNEPETDPAIDLPGPEIPAPEATPSMEPVIGPESPAPAEAPDLEPAAAEPPATVIEIVPGEAAPTTPWASTPDVPAPDPPAPATAPTVASPPAPPLLESATQLLTVARLAEGVLAVAGDGGFDFTGFRLENPERFVIDLHGVINRSDLGALTIDEGVLLRVRVSQYRTRPTPVTRVIFDLRTPTVPAIEPAADGLLVRFAAPNGRAVPPR